MDTLSSPFAPRSAVPNACPKCHAEHAEDLATCPVDGAPLGPSSASADPLIGRLLADRYKVLRTIGEGGMGRVYLAEHVRMGRLSAVKVMSPALTPTADAIGRFNREAANASRINQPNVAAIYDFGETEDGTLYLAMEYVEGETLSAVLRREGPFSPMRAAEITGQIADGLTAAHHLGIVHRDLKPDNILVTRSHDGREWVKIVDFGIAKATQADADQNVTSLGMAVGTPEYMSPEQIAGEQLDGRTDLYSLGLVLFNMLTGALPHPALTSKQSLVLRLTARPRTLADVRPNVAWPARLQVALDRALAPEPADRFRSVGELAAVVRAAVGSPSASGAPTQMMTPLHVEAVPTRPISPRATAARKRSWRAPLVAVILLVVGAGVVVARPPQVVREFLKVYDVSLPRAAASQPTSAHARTDSVTQAGTVSAALVAARDSANPAVPDSGGAGAHAAGADSLSPLGSRYAAAHLGALGDSTGLGGAPGTQTAEQDAREVLMHVTKARELARTMMLKGAGMELRTAYEEYRIFLTEHAAAPQTAMLRQELQTAMDEGLAACRTARDSVAARGGPAFKCQHPAKTGILMDDSEDASAPATPTP
ncbi:MAG TPA: serine/threonine-protein kinase, partial [Gemmatimonadaceae bacterium]|nr:serine/threonine-protein kinase [Gemmatimonadaceae bacterium]